MAGEIEFRKSDKEDGMAENIEIRRTREIPREISREIARWISRLLDFP